MSSVPIPRTFQAGELETAAFLNSLTSVCNFLLNTPKARIASNAATSYASGTDILQAFQVVSYDTDGMSNLGSANDRLTVKTAGKYLVIGTLNWSTNGTNGRNNQIFVNGANVAGNCVEARGGSQDTIAQVFYTGQFNVNDYIQLDGWQDSGSTLTALGDLTAIWIGQ